MTLPQFALTNRYTVWAVSIGIIAFGTLAYFRIPIQLYPETAPPLVNVLTAYPGATAQDVADLVSDPIEEESASLAGVYRVSSTSQDGLSLVTVEFDYDISVDLAAVDVQNAISRIRSKLPPEVQEPQILKFSTSDRPILTVGLTGDDLVAARRIAEDILAPELQRVSGVAMVDVFGGHAPEVTVSVDRGLLEAHGLRFGSVVDAIRTHNVSAPAGQIRSRGRQHAFRIDSQVSSPEDLGRIPITTPAGGRVLVGDVAQIREGSGDDLSRYRVDGVPAIALQVFKQDDANTVAVVRRVQGKFDGFREKYPAFGFVEAEESASFTQQVVENMLGSVGQALLLATVVIFLFLGSVRRGLVVAISMPMSFLLTFAVMWMVGIQLDLITLTAIILAVGMVVDGSVVVLENITRRFQSGDISADGAAMEGATEIQFAVIAGNATTVTVLIPLLFLSGFVGKTFGPLAGTLLIAFLSSLLVALTLVPILTAIVSREGGRVEAIARRVVSPWGWLMNRTQNAYVWLLHQSLRHRFLLFGVVVVLFVIGIYLLRLQGMELLPKMDSGASFVTIETPAGSSLDETERVVREVEQIILSEPSVERLSIQAGFEPGMHSFGGGGVQGPTQAYMSLTLTPRTEREESIWEIQDRLRRRLGEVPGIQMFVVRESGSTAKATTASSIVVSIKGADPLIIDGIGDSVLARISSVENLGNPYRSWRIDQRSSVLRIDQERARELGLSPAGVAQELAQVLDGQMAGIMRGNLGTDSPIRVRYAEEFRATESDVLAARMVSRNDGRSVPLRAIADVQEYRVQGLITRDNLQPALDVLAMHQDRPLNFVSRDVERSIATLTIPSGYEVGMEGENKDMTESRNELVGALVASLIAVYLLLVAQFRSFLHPISVLLAVPLSLIGVSVALWIAGKPVSMPVMVGLILLVGIVVNNSIIIIDFIRQRQREGKTRREAIVESVGTRFRPIMMTSLSTIVGMLPLAFEWALGAEKFSPLAVAVIGGMTASTFLTMIVIPVAFDAMEELRTRSRSQSA